MSESWAVALRPARRWTRLVLLGALVALSGCATHFVDGAVKEVATGEFTRPARPQPVQLVFEFQTRGAANAHATAGIRPAVLASVTQSGLFSQVQDTPVAGAGILSVKIDNVPLTDDAAGRAFMTGLTFGLAGSSVTDGYVCTVSYLTPRQATPIVKTARHAIHTNLGSGAAPANSFKAANIEDAVRTMLRQVLSVALNDLSRDPAFRGSQP